MKITLVKCPKCGAEPGKRCRRPSGKVLPYLGSHREREIRAKNNKS